MSDYGSREYVRCKQLLESRAASDEHLRNVRTFVNSWPGLVLASDTPNYSDHKRALHRIDALAALAATERKNLIVDKGRPAATGT